MLLADLCDWIRLFVYVSGKQTLVTKQIIYLLVTAQAGGCVKTRDLPGSAQPDSWSPFSGVREAGDFFGE